MLDAFYPWIKAFHLIAVMCWMVGIFYLPRLFSYHAAAKIGSDKARTFAVMERRLLKIIMTPAMVVSWALGLGLLALHGDLLQEGWMVGKLGLVLGLSWYHFWLARVQKRFYAEEKMRSEKFYRYMNEAPTILLVAIVILAVVKPF